MTLDRRTREQLLAHCGQIHDDDCVNPHYFQKPKRDHRTQSRKAKQLCRQVAETLDLVLSGDCHDELLQSLHVEAVEPAPDASRLLVTLCTEVADSEAVLGLLNGQMGRLRCEVAAAITRKRAPTLVFRVVAPVDG